MAIFFPIQNGIPSYFLPMIGDTDRNIAYEKAIKQTIEGFIKDRGYKPSVLDVGAGSGMLTLMALKHGALHVTALEANENLSAILKEILSVDHGSPDEKKRWDIVQKLSLDFDPNLPECKQKKNQKKKKNNKIQKHLNADKKAELHTVTTDGSKTQIKTKVFIKYDIVICELLGSMINSESMALYLYDIVHKKNLLNSFEGKHYVIPNSATMTMRPYECPQAFGIVTGLPEFDTSLNLVFKEERGKNQIIPNNVLNWNQDEQEHLCLATSCVKPLADAVEVLYENYATSTIKCPREVLFVVSNNHVEEGEEAKKTKREKTNKTSDQIKGINKQTEKIHHNLNAIFVLEWICELAPNVFLNHRLNYVKNLPSASLIARWIEWGHLFVAVPKGLVHNYEIHYGPAGLLFSRVQSPNLFKFQSNPASQSLGKVLVTTKGLDQMLKEAKQKNFLHKK
jgi:predicted RNA methylase